MGNINIKPVRKKVTLRNRTREQPLYEEADLRKFNPFRLGLGNIGKNSRQINAIAVVFDLSGFTKFCNQADYHLRMPVFLKEFLKWLFENIRSSIVLKRLEEGVRTFTYLPFFAKFTGDGVLFLWDTKDMNDDRICNVVVHMDQVSRDYRDIFVPQIRKRVTNIPVMLRCGVARGEVCSVGNGKDYVGQCINRASKLQNLFSGLRFCCWGIGIEMEKGMMKSTVDKYERKIVEIKAIGEEDLVIIRKEDFEKLLPEDQEKFKDVDE